MKTNEEKVEEVKKGKRSRKKSNAEAGPVAMDHVAEMAQSQELGKYTSYVIIAIVTLLFNSLAFFATYMCCIKKKGFNTNIQYVEGKAFDNIDSDIETDEDALNEDV